LTVLREGGRNLVKVQFGASTIRFCLFEAIDVAPHRPSFGRQEDCEGKGNY